MGDFSTASEEAFNAYLAGFMDGEGNIMIYPKECHVRITLANCVESVLRAMRHRLGYGAIRSQKQRENWRERFVLVITNAHDCRDFLTRTRPFLHIKAAEADVALSAEMQRRMDELDARNRAIVAAVRGGRRQKDVAAEHGISQQLVSRILNGHCTPARRPKRYNWDDRWTRGRTRGRDAGLWPV